MARYEVNPDAVTRCRDLIDAKQYVLESDWGTVQPGADAQNSFLAHHTWEEYGAWHLGLQLCACRTCRGAGTTFVRAPWLLVILHRGVDQSVTVREPA